MPLIWILYDLQMLLQNKIYIKLYKNQDGNVLASDYVQVVYKNVKCK